MNNDLRDAEDLVDLLRLGRLAEAWIAPKEIRELRELVRHRAKLVALRTNCKLQVYSVLAKEGVAVPMADLFGVAGRALLGEASLAPAYAARVESLVELIEAFDAQITRFERAVARELADHAGHHAIQAIPGVGPVFAAIFVAEIGDVTRFTSPARLCSWAGLTPRHRESDTTLHRGPITKQGSRLVRWAAVEAASARREGPSSGRTSPASPPPTTTPKGPGVARVALARKIVTLVYYGARRHHPLEGHRGGVSGSGHHQARDRSLSWPPALRRGRALD